MTLHFAMADDGNDRLFHALTDNCHHDGSPITDDETKRPVWVFIDRENGWGKNVGELAMLELKKAPSGHFVS